MHRHQWQAHDLKKPTTPELMKIRIKATGKVTIATSCGFGWLVASGKIYTKHTAEFLGRVEQS